MNRSVERSYISGRQLAEMGRLSMTMDDVADFAALTDLGIHFSKAQIKEMAMFAMDSQQSDVSAPSITTPVQFLQNWLPGFVKVITAAQRIDTLCGITTIGSWEDEEIVQGLLEPIGDAVPYGDYTNVPLSSWNVNFVRRTVVRFEKGLKVGMLEQARAARIRVDTASEKRNSAALALEIERNLIGFNGFNNGNNLTYGFLNDPGLPAYVPVAATGTGGSTLWSTKDYQAISADIRTAMAQLQNQSQDNIFPEHANLVLAVPTAQYQYLTVTTNFNGFSVKDWLLRDFKGLRIVSAPQLNMPKTLKMDLVMAVGLGYKLFLQNLWH